MSQAEPNSGAVPGDIFPLADPPASTESDLRDNYRLAADKADSAYYSCGIFAIFFTVIASGNVGKLALFGTSIEHPKAFLGALAVLSAFQFYSATTIGCFAELIWEELDYIERERQNVGIPKDARWRPRRRAFDLLTPPTVMRLIVSRAFPAIKPKQESSDFGWALTLWFLRIVAPCLFFAWSVYVLTKQNDNWSMGSALVVGSLCWRAIRTFIRVLDKGNRAERG